MPRASSRLQNKRKNEPAQEKSPAPKRARKTTKKDAKKTDIDVTEKSEHETTSKSGKEQTYHHESKTLEKGHIYFFYRPKIEHDDAESADDVQKLYLALVPHQESDHRDLCSKRLFVLTKKKLPKSQEKFWAFVDKSSKNVDDIVKQLGPSTYETKTRGTRHQSGAKPCGCGVYSIVHHIDSVYVKSQHTHLAYVLEVPETPGEVQHAFNIEKEGSFIFTLKNPKKSQPEQAGLQKENKAEFSKDEQKQFENKRFVTPETIELLDHEGAEIIMIGTKKDLVEDLGKPAKDLEATAAKEEKEEHVKKDHGCKLADDHLKELHMRRKEFPAKPLIDGKWE